MGGNLEWTNQRQGSLFRGHIYLDVHNLNVVEHAPDVPSHLEPPARMVLVAEDNEVNLRLMTRYLDSLGIRYVTAENGKKAVEVYEQYKKDICLILMDIQVKIYISTNFLSPDACNGWN
jgi:PleD family two-component response regulator